MQATLSSMTLTDLCLMKGRKWWQAFLIALSSKRLKWMMVSWGDCPPNSKRDVSVVMVTIDISWRKETATTLQWTFHQSRKCFTCWGTDSSWLCRLCLFCEYTDLSHPWKQRSYNLACSVIEVQASMWPRSWRPFLTKVRVFYWIVLTRFDSVRNLSIGR